MAVKDSDASMLKSIAYEAVGFIGGTTLAGRLPGIRTECGQTKVNDGIIA
jgi:hypothetical protein